MLTPSRVRYRKTQRGRMKGKAHRNCDVLYGSHGLMSLTPIWVTANQIESARVAINRVVKKFGKMWIRIFPDKPYTKKPAETRMGKGKGAPEGWVAVVKPGRILFELAGADRPHAREALRLGAQKLPIKTGFVAAED